MNQTSAKLFTLNVILCIFAFGIFSKNRAGDAGDTGGLDENLSGSFSAMFLGDCAVRLPPEINNILLSVYDQLKKTTHEITPRENAAHENASIEELCVLSQAALPVSCKTALSGIKSAIDYAEEKTNGLDENSRRMIVDQLSNFNKKLLDDVASYAGISNLQNIINKRLASATKKGGEASVTGNSDQDVAMFLRTYDRLELAKSKTMIVDPDN